MSEHTKTAPPARAGDTLRAALEYIADPIAAIRREIEGTEYVLDGAMAARLANDAGHLREYARRALASTPPVVSPPRVHAYSDTPDGVRSVCGVGPFTHDVSPPRAADGVSEALDELVALVEGRVHEGRPAERANYDRLIAETRAEILAALRARRETTTEPVNSTGEVPMVWSSIITGLEQAKRGEGRELTEEDFAPASEGATPTSNATTITTKALAIPAIPGTLEHEAAKREAGK